MQGTIAANPPSVSSPPRSVDRRALLLALALAAVAAWLTVAYLRSLDNRRSEGPTLSVLVASREIAAGTKLTDGMVELKALPESAAVAGALTAKEHAVGQTVRYPLARGEQLTGARLVEPPKVQTLSFQIPEGKRGFTIPVSVTKSPAALLAPGDFVDVLATVDMTLLGVVPPERPGARNRDYEFSSGVTLIQNVQVLSVQRQYVDNGVPYDSSVRGAPPKESNITYLTLAVTPEQAQMLALLVEKAKMITVSLRPFGDEETKNIRPFMEPSVIDLFTDPGVPGTPPVSRS